MTRIKRGKITLKVRRKRKQSTKGFRGAWSTLSRPMIQGSLRSLNFSYQHRRKKINNFRRLAILRSNALIRACGLPFTYNKMINVLKIYKCKLNRNIINQLGTRDSKTFIQLMGFYSS